MRWSGGGGPTDATPGVRRAGAGGGRGAGVPAVPRGVRALPQDAQVGAAGGGAARADRAESAGPGGAAGHGVPPDAAQDPGSAGAGAGGAVQRGGDLAGARAGGAGAEGAGAGGGEDAARGAGGACGRDQLRARRRGAALGVDGDAAETGGVPALVVAGTLRGQGDAGRAAEGQAGDRPICGVRLGGPRAAPGVLGAPAAGLHAHQPARGAGRADRAPTAGAGLCAVPAVAPQERADRCADEAGAGAYAPCAGARRRRRMPAHRTDLRQRAQALAGAVDVPERPRGAADQQCCRAGAAHHRAQAQDLGADPLATGRGVHRPGLHGGGELQAPRPRCADVSAAGDARVLRRHRGALAGALGLTSRPVPAGGLCFTGLTTSVS